MSCVPRAGCRAVTQFLIGSAFLVSTIALLGGLPFPVAAQRAIKAAAKEEGEEPAKSAQQAGKKPVKEEEEEKVPPKPRAPLRVGDEQADVKERPNSGRPADLEREAKEAKYPVARQLCKDLLRPHDVVRMPAGGVILVKPLRQYIGSSSNFKGSLSLRALDETRQLVPVSRRDISSIEPYEDVALTKVDEFLKTVSAHEAEAGQKYPSRLEALQLAERIIEAVIVFHESARERGVREGEEWDEVKKRLDDRLQAIRLDQLRALTGSETWDAAFELASRLKEKYPKRKEVLLAIARLWAAHAEQSLLKHDYEAARKRLGLLEVDFPSSPEIDAIRDRLRRRAMDMVEEARKLEKENPKKAMAQLQTAESIYPQLPGLHDFYLRLNDKYPILYIGVRELPEYLSPAKAVTDTEKQAVELVFESLVRLHSTAHGGQRYQPGLAVDLPRLVPLGREFQLAGNTFWSDGRQVTAADVRHTVQLLSDRQWPGRVPEWADLLEEGARIEGDALHISLTLRQGYFEPLALMDFKVLPEEVRRADDTDFAKQPIGSGPFRYKGREEGASVFLANPFFGSRPGKSGLPHIREIRFVQSADVAEDFRQGRLQLLLDLPSRKCKELASVQDRVTVQTLASRRVHFLAANHRRAPLQNLSLRRALAYSINRDKILSICFRDGHADWHRPLSTPYPPGTWASKRDLAPLYNAVLAKAQAEIAKEARVTLSKLTLKYPAGDPAIAEACTLIRKQVEELGAGIQLELVSRSPAELRQDVEELHDYDLAYYHWDYANEAYWLWPLFDPQATAPGGRNFLGYENDGDLQSLFRQVMTHRDLAVVQRLTQEIQVRLLEQMPLIPLWQLDTHIAVHNNLRMEDAAGKPIVPDPLSVFTDVEFWSMKKN